MQRKTTSSIRVADAGRSRRLCGVGLCEFKVQIPVAAVEATDAMLLELGLANWSLHEDAIAKEAWLIGIFADESAARKHWAELKPMLPTGPMAEPAARVLTDEDWRESYKAHFRPWRFGRLHWAPVWERKNYHVSPGEATLWLDPGLAFGTGNHETTRLCCEGLVAFAEKKTIGARVIDIGCGSGILALSAAVLGFRRVIGFDNDPEAVRISCENAALNGLSDHVTFFVGDLKGALAEKKAELVLANIQADVLMRFAVELTGAVAPGGELILSGILAEELLPVGAKFAATVPAWSAGWRTSGEWASLTLARPAG